MGLESASAHDDRDSDDDEDFEEAGGGSRLLGFMFGNVDNSGELEVDYLDEDAKEHLDALADKLGASLTDIDLSGKSQAPAAAGEEEYDEKAEDAVDYEDFDEQYEGPEIETAATEEDHLLPKIDYFPVDVSATTLPSMYDEENYDEDEGNEEKDEVVANESEAVNPRVPVLVLNQADGGKLQQVENDLAAVEITAPCLPLEQPENDLEVSSDEICLKPLVESVPVLTDSSTVFAESEEEEPAPSHDAVDVKSSTPLPILCVENGMAVLRFSEIFGVNEPLKKAEKREQNYSVSKDKYISLDPSLMVEDDEGEFLRGSCQVSSARRLTTHTQENYDSFIGNYFEGPRFDHFDWTCSIHNERKDSCYSAEPMRKDLSLDSSVEWRSSKSNVFYSFDHADWEDRIEWGNSPAVSENSMESCELSGPDTDIIVHEEKEITSCQHDSFSDCIFVPNEKNNMSQLALSSVSAKPFDSGDHAGLSNTSYAENMLHPQLLRLESQLDSWNFAEARKGLQPEDHQRLDFMKRFELLTLQNKDLAEGSWIKDIIWESEKPIIKRKLIYDLQDEHMVFEISDNKDYDDLQPHAGALITIQSGDSSADMFGFPGHVALSGGRFDIANDKFYSNWRVSPQMKSLQKKRASDGVKIVHSNPARMLQTMKLKLSNKDIANFHRPKATWYPHDNMIAVKELEKLHTGRPMKVILKSLGGKGSKIHVDLEETIAIFKTKASKKLEFEITEPVKIFYMGQELEDQKTFEEQNVRPNSLLHLIRTKIFLLPMAQKVPNEKKSWCPPSGFKKKSDLSVRDGHVFLMEYCEERPLLVGNAGMAARLTTFYQKTSLDDQAGDLLRNADSGLGTVLALDPSEKSPFLGDIKPGCNQSCLETNMYKAPVFPHKVASTDYLLVRSAKGKLSIRRIDKVYVVGQQEPLKEVLPPGAKGVQNYQINRLLAYVYREFRAAEKRNAVPCIRADVLPALFPNIQEPVLRKRLKHCADLQRRPRGLLHWVKKSTYRMPADQDIHSLVLPEDVCAYESMQAGLYRLKRLGITRLAQTGPTQLATLSSAMNQLPDEAIALAAASHIERELQITPWNLSANFVACIRQDRGNIERLEISGVGDPSGRGLGFSYVRVAQKPPMSNALVKKKPVVAKGSTVTGTDADLRRLSMDAAREVLLKFNIPEEQIGKLSRWYRIALIRKLSSEQAASGVKVDESTINKYARGQRMSYNQLQQQTREKCQDIWDRQIQSLSAFDGEENESDTEANSDLDSFAGDLENLLDAEEGEEGKEGSVEIKNYKSDAVKGLKMRRHPPQARRQEEIEDETAEALELCKILVDDDGAKWKRKPKAIEQDSGGTRHPQWKFAIESAQQVQKPNSFVKHNDELAAPYDLSSVKQNNESMEVEKMLSKKTYSAKVKAAKKNEVVPVDLQNKKIRIMTDGGIKAFKEKKSARDSFVCGACGQLGHMRTNKNCPKYKEDPEGQGNYTDQEMEAVKPVPQDSSQSQQRVSAKKSMASMSNTAQVEPLEGENEKLMAKTLKVKYASADKAPDKVTSVQSVGSDQPSTSEAEVGNKRGPKIIKIISNKKPDISQVESQKLSVVIRPPSDIGREQQHKKITIKQPKKEVINLDLTSEEGTDMAFRKTKKMVELAGYGSSRQQGVMHFAEEASRKNKAPRRMWDEEEQCRNFKHMQKVQATMLFEEEMMRADEDASLDELRRYAEDIRSEREEEDRKANKKMKKKRKAAEFSDDLEDFQAGRSSRLLPGRDRSVKRKTMKFSAEYAPPKRRKGGEVGLANILETIVDALRNRREVSYLFLKPVTKKDAPDYLQIVQYPMDLSTIKERTRRLEYRSREEFRRDIWQIAYNAHLYNDGRNPSIPPLADQLLEICDHLLDLYADSLDDAEAGITDI